jgi:preprotein translocase subunit SecD
LRAVRSKRADRAGIIALSLAILDLGLSPAVAEPLTLDVMEATSVPDRSGNNQAVLTVRLAESSRQAFADFSKAHVGQAINVTVAGKSVTKPVIREPITGGVISIAVLTIDEGRKLAARLTSKTAKLDVEVAQ